MFVTYKLSTENHQPGVWHLGYCEWTRRVIGKGQENDGTNSRTGKYTMNKRSPCNRFLPSHFICSFCNHKFSALELKLLCGLWPCRVLLTTRFECWFIRVKRAVLLAKVATKSKNCARLVSNLINIWTHCREITFVRCSSLKLFINRLTVLNCLSTITSQISLGHESLISLGPFTALTFYGDMYLTFF